eukprot:m.65318 g.65318  ORF g.65318 m.65318 type:complete len:498 (+) comp9752_c0_seq2:643-2136(+)
MPQCADYGLVITALLSVFFFSGILLGWAPFMHALLEEGQFEELCHDVENITRPADKLGKCDAQLNELNLIFTLGSATISASSLPCGIFLDTYGPRAAVFVSLLFELSGLVLLAFADSRSFDVFVPGVLGIAVGGLMIMISAFPISFRFPKHQSTILATISCLFDASSLIFAVFDYVQQFFTRKQLMLGYAVFCAVLYCLVLLFWSITGFTPPGEEQTGRVDPDDDDQLIDGVWTGSIQERKQLQLVVGSEGPVDNPPQGTAANNEGEAAHGHDLTQKGIWTQVMSFEFMFLIAFGSIQMLRANAYIGFNDELLARYGDDVSCHGWYTSLFGWILPASIVFIPLIDGCICYFGLGGTLHITNVFGAIYGGLVLIPSLKVQLGTFAVFVCFRAFLYATMSTYTAEIFGLATLGRITGSLFTASAVFVLLQYPLQWMTSSQFDSNPTVSSVILLGLCAPMGVLVLWWQVRRRPRRLQVPSDAAAPAIETDPLLPRAVGVQ